MIVVVMCKTTLRGLVQITMEKLTSLIRSLKSPHLGLGVCTRYAHPI